MNGPRPPQERSQEASVIIPALNAASTLPMQLRALCEQIAPPGFEVIVADNGSSDATREVVDELRGELDIRLVDASAVAGPSYARNRGAAAAATDKLLFCDADDRVGNSWVRSMYRALEESRIATGPVIYVDRIAETPSEPPATAPTTPRKYLGQMPFATSNNVSLDARLFEELGGFDLALRCGEDADLSIRAQMAGAALAWTDGALVFQARRESLWRAARQFFRYGYYDPLVFRNLRGCGLSQRNPSEMVRPYLAVLATPHRLLSSNGRTSWVINASQLAGRIVGSIRFGVLCP